MATILVLLNDVINSIDPIENAKVHKAGDFIVVREDFHIWGSKEAPPLFSEIRIPGIPESSVKKYEEVYYDVNDDIINMRIWKFDLDKAPQIVVDKLVAGNLTIKTTGYTGSFDLEWETARNFFYDKKNDVYETMDLP